MGDGADMALDNAFNDCEHFDRYEYSDTATQYEEGLIDSYGYRIGNRNSLPFVSYPMCRNDYVRSKPYGKGKCPKCKSDTVKRKGKHGYFYGCTQFPRCNGSRSCN